ncbi:MAG: ribonuclease P protein component [Bacteroidales bacterium]|nr:ribonuclease P protein component [Bacteroidales bacterium]
MINNIDKPFGFSKSEKLCSKMLIEKLYSSPNRELFFPLSIRWCFIDASESTEPVQVLIVAPKRKLHHAVDRNRTKRIIRECYRLNKKPLVDAIKQKDLHIVLSLNYIHTHTPNFHKLEASMVKLVTKLTETINNHD